MPRIPERSGLTGEWEALSESLGRLAAALTRTARGPARATGGEGPDDLVQETIARLLAKPPHERPAPLYPYARAVLVRLYLDRERSARRRAARALRAARAAAGPRAQRDPVAGREQARAVRDALDRLSPQQRAAVTLRLVDGAGYEQIAHALGSTPDTVRASLHAARVRLRAALAEHREHTT